MTLANGLLSSSFTRYSISMSVSADHYEEEPFDEGPYDDEPTPADYRRRRIIALIAALLLLLLLIWGITSLIRGLTGGGDDNKNDAAGAATSSSAAPFSDFSDRASESASASVSSSADPSASHSAEASSDPSASASESAHPTASESASAAATESASATESAEQTPAATESAAPTQAAPATPVACSAADLKVAVSADKEVYAAGENPALAVTYTNTSGNPCNLGGQAAQPVDLNITSGSAQVYNFAQCQKAEAPTGELAAGRADTKVITWDRKINALGCGNTQDIQPGYYWATATVNGVTSEPARIIVKG